jgi:hypothetical protein
MIARTAIPACAVTGCAWDCTQEAERGGGHTLAARRGPCSHWRQEYEMLVRGPRKRGRPESRGTRPLRSRVLHPRGNRLVDRDSTVRGRLWHSDEVVPVVGPSSPRPAGQRHVFGPDRRSGVDSSQAAATERGRTRLAGSAELAKVCGNHHKSLTRNIVNGLGRWPTPRLAAHPSRGSYSSRLRAGTGCEATSLGWPRITSSRSRPPRCGRKAWGNPDEQLPKFAPGR